jgi:hypothetical protein
MLSLRREATIFGMEHLSSAAEARLCRLQYEAGRVEQCPEERCPFWEEAGAGSPGRCAVEQVDVSGNPALASWLLGVRKELEAVRTNRDEQGCWRLFYRLLNEGQGE